MLRVSLERILLLYDEAVVSLRQASEAILSGDDATKSEALANALVVLMELRAGLDHGVDPELTRNLEDLYTYSINRVFAGHSLNDFDAVEQAIKVIEVLRVGWRDLGPEIAAD